MQHLPSVRTNIFMSNYEGGGQPLALKPKFSEFFSDYTHLKEYFILMDAWQYRTAYEEIYAAVSQGKLAVDAYKMMAMINLIQEDYALAKLATQHIIRLEPHNHLATFLKTYINHIIYGDGHFYTMQATLDKVDPVVYSKILHILKYIEESVVFKQFLKVEDLPSDIDVLVIFGSNVNDDGTVSDNLEERLKLALQVAQKIPTTKLIVSGGTVVNNHNEALVMRQWLIKAGIAADRIITDPFSKDTLGRATYSGQIILNQGFQNPCVITSPDHLKRSWLTLKTFIKAMDHAPINIYGALDSHVSHGTIPDDEKKRTYISILQAAGFFTDWFEEFN